MSRISGSYIFSNCHTKTFVWAYLKIISDRLYFNRFVFLFTFIDHNIIFILFQFPITVNFLSALFTNLNPPPHTHTLLILRIPGLEHHCKLRGGGVVIEGGCKAVQSAGTGGLLVGNLKVLFRRARHGGKKKAFLSNGLMKTAPLRPHGSLRLVGSEYIKRWKTLIM